VGGGDGLNIGVAGKEVVDFARPGEQSIENKKDRPGFGGLADATERGESSGAVLPELDVLKEAAREAAN
jgi:hypothetical protein